jgi:hypothetical protein
VASFLGSAATLGEYRAGDGIPRRTGSVLQTLDPACPGQVAALGGVQQHRAAAGFALTRGMELTERAQVPAAGWVCWPKMTPPGSRNRLAALIAP